MSKSKFSAEEQQTLITLPWIAGAAVSECDKVGGAREEAKEGEALQSAVAACFLHYQTKTKENFSSNEAKAFDFEKAESLLAKAAEEALALHASKDAANLDLYKKLVLEVSFGVAMAYGAGRGGKGPRVSDKELSMIKKIADVLKATHLFEEVQKDAEAHAPK